MMAADVVTLDLPSQRDLGIYVRHLMYEECQEQRIPAIQMYSDCHC